MATGRVCHGVARAHFSTSGAERAQSRSAKSGHAQANFHLPQQMGWRGSGSRGQNKRGIARAR
eukprot:4601482-Pyramimonas_sp.AAC.1